MPLPIAGLMTDEPLETVLECAEDRGKATGLATSCAVTHATPAAFAAHVRKRKMQAEIAEQMTASGVDVLFGGGWAYFVPSSVEGSKREDDKNPLADLESRMPVARTPNASNSACGLMRLMRNFMASP